jgi:formylmethanofuran dehydrogenase subunit E
VARGQPEEIYCSRVEGPVAVTRKQYHVCAECGQQVIFIASKDDPLDLRIVCKVCLVERFRT